MKQKKHLKKLCILLLTFVCISAVAQNDNALHFNHGPYIIGDHFSLPNGNDEFTLEVWVKFPELGDRLAIATWANDAAGDADKFSYEFNIEAGRLLYTEWGPVHGWTYHYAPVTMSNDIWHHVAFVRKAYPGDDSADNNIFLYADGVEVYRGKGVDTSDFVTDYFTIGALKFFSGGYQHKFSGAMDELRVWNYAKTQNEIRGQMISKLGATEDNLLAYYPFDEGVAGGDNTLITNVVDVSENSPEGGALVGFDLTGDTSNFVETEDYTSLGQGTFITTWEVDETTGLEIIIPINTNTFYGNYTYDYSVNWGDGNITTETGNADHTYQNAGTYTVTISGDFPAIYFNNTNLIENNLEKIRTVEQWGFIEWESMANAFFGCTNLEVIASDTPNLNAVEYMWGAFRISGVTGQNTDFNSWDVSNVEAFSIMFEHSNFDANITSWDFSSMDVSRSADIFGREDGTGLSDLAPMSCLNTSLTLVGWADNANTPSGYKMTVSDYLDARIVTSSVSELTDNKSWDIKIIHDGACSDSGIESEYFITTWEVEDETGLDITIPINDDYNYEYFIDWGDGSALEFYTGSANYTYGIEGRYDVKIFGNFPAIQFNNEGENSDGVVVNKDKITEVKQWGAIKWQSMSGAFFGCINLDVTATDIPNLENVTDMFAMFDRVKFFEGGNIGQWDVSNVTSLSHIFWGATSFNVDLGDWDVSNVTNMTEMFNSVAMDCNNYANTLIGWAEHEVSEGIVLSVHEYSDAAQAAVNTLTMDKNWTINGTEVTEAACNDTLSINDEVFSNTISVSPNPVTSLLTINGPAGFELKSASVYSIMGKQVLSTISTNIDTNNLPSGLYILKIENTEGQIAIKKIVKQ
ncbi:Por secretion system C-terminal sorting domain-containing protein [Algibacter lectus]|uniref:BspA family leucine-rich repeat surface protein n=1 Tax=Algibacter lectus TaxID=221126 RepID=UPI0008E9DC68|nr:BspA family leucine-rich repeat surface protein [Algibacter lectus]SFB92161.1 Por secretion system C-terminal sorting domain-containing protein [Algibacter lectus]